MLTNYHILQVKTLPATNTNAARVKIISERFKQSVVIGFSNDPGASNPTLYTGVSYLVNAGYNIIGQGEGKDHYYLISTTFEPLM